MRRGAIGSWVLLQPERINAYAQAVIRTLQADERQRGCLMEERVLKGDLERTQDRRIRGTREKEVGLLAGIPGSGDSWKLRCFLWSFFRVVGVFRG